MYIEAILVTYHQQTQQLIDWKVGVLLDLKVHISFLLEVHEIFRRLVLRRWRLLYKTGISP